MRIGRAAGWTAGVTAALVGGVAIALLSFDLDAYRDRVAAAISEATGRPASFGGKLSLALSLRPKLVAEGATLGNPPGFSRPEMVRIDRLEAVARLWPLLGGRIEIERLELEGVDLLLERRPEGPGNWSFAGDDAAPSGASLPRISDFVARDVVLGWRSGDDARTLRLDRLEASERDGAMAMEASGSLEDRPIYLRGRFAMGPEDGDQTVAARELALGFGEVEARGELTAVLAAARPRIEGALSVATLDLDRALGPGSPPADGRLIPEAALDPAPLDALDLALSLRVDRLVAGGLTFEEAAARILLEAGRLQVADLSAALAGGRLSGTGEARGRGAAVAVALQLDLSQAELDQLAPAAGVSGKVDAKADLKSHGESLRALAGSLKGEVRLLGRDGRVAGRALDFAAADLLRLLAPWSEQGGDTRVACMLFASTIRDGRAKTDALAIDADRVLITGEGVIDLGRERIDLQLTPRPKEASLVSLATPVNVRGPLADPSVSPDEMGLLRSAAGAVLGNLVLPGAGFLLPFLSAGAGDHPCAATLAPAAPASQPAKEEGGVGGFFRGLGRTIDRTLGTGR